MLFLKKYRTYKLERERNEKGCPSEASSPTPSSCSTASTKSFVPSELADVSDIDSDAISDIGNACNLVFVFQLILLFI